MINNNQWSPMTSRGPFRVISDEDTACKCHMLCDPAIRKTWLTWHAENTLVYQQGAHWMWYSSRLRIHYQPPNPLIHLIHHDSTMIFINILSPTMTLFNGQFRCPSPFSPQPQLTRKKRPSNASSAWSPFNNQVLGCRQNSQNPMSIWAICIHVRFMKYCGNALAFLFLLAWHWIFFGCLFQSLFFSVEYWMLHWIILLNAPIQKRNTAVLPSWQPDFMRETKEKHCSLENEANF